MKALLPAIPGVIALVCFVISFFCAKDSVRRWVRSLAYVSFLVAFALQIYVIVGDIRTAQTIKRLQDETKDLAKFKRLAARHEFTPISREMRDSLVAQLRPLKTLFDTNGLKIKITHETWVQPNTREFAKQLASILSEAGFQVQGPSGATVFLVRQGPPLTWRYNQNDVALVGQLHSVLSAIIKKSSAHGRDTSIGKGYVIVHFAGQTVFEPTGIVSVE